MKKLFALLAVVLLFQSKPLFAQSKTAFVNAGEKAFNGEDYASALNYFIAAQEYNETDAYIMLMTGECYRRLFEYNTALAWFNKSILTDKNHRYPENYYRKAETLFALNDMEESRKMINNFSYSDSSLNALNLASSLRRKIENSTAIQNQKDSTDFADAGKNVNTAFSDFAAVAIDDTTILFSSLKFEYTHSKKKEYASMILKASMDSLTIGKATLLPVEINNKTWHNCNASVSPDGKIMVFSRCSYNSENKLMCKLYESQNLNGKWQQPVVLNNDLNLTGSTSTQPCITSKGVSGYDLYFVSDRTGGDGLTDIYYSLRNAKGDYAKSQPVKNVNSAGREVSPFFNPITGILYFSSDSLDGLGGFDIYKLSLQDSLPQNAGLPFNSGYNDIYYSENLHSQGSGFFSSNRPGTMTLGGNVCCYDIFRFHPSPPVVEEIATREKAEPVLLQPAELKNDPVVLAGSLKKLLPLKLYFDNDYPDPGSTKKTTTAVYNELYSKYSTKIGNYIEGFSGDKTRSADEARDAIEKFFITELQYNYKQLDQFTSLLYEALIDSNTVELTVQGFASPLAETGYNLILSSRRIGSLVNYWKTTGNGKMTIYLSSGKLVIVEQAAGERAVEDISDNVNDKANSVYNPRAAAERKIEVINVSISKP